MTTSLWVRNDTRNNSFTVKLNHQREFLIALDKKNASKFFGFSKAPLGCQEDFGKEE